LLKQYPHRTYKVRHHLGIDTSSLFVSRIGVRNDNDLVWVGRAANYAAKLCAIREYDTTFITEEVFNVLLDADGRIYREPLIETVPLYESSQQTFAQLCRTFSAAHGQRS
jgi:class 3 adenylate cyclase